MDAWLELQDRKRERRIASQRHAIKRLIRIYARYAKTDEKRDKLQAIATYADKHAFIPSSYMTWLEDLMSRDRTDMDTTKLHATRSKDGRYCPD